MSDVDLGMQLLTDAIGRGEKLDLLAYADWLTERGESPRLVHALRWCARRDCRPRLSPQGQTAAWEVRRNAGKKTSAAALPRIVFDQIKSGSLYKGTRLFRGVPRPALVAYRALADALEKLREAYEL